MYNNKKKKERNINLDLIRVLAVISVLSVHFFLNNEYYLNKMLGEKMFLMTLVRTFFMICVPLFIILTGYLMNKKQLSKEYYKGISKILYIYIFISICCLIYRYIFLNVDFSIKQAIFSVLSFEAAPYSWYIEMYIGLFLLIPFLNLIYSNLENKKSKLILLITLLILTCLPSILNIYNFDSVRWFFNPSLSSNYQLLVPKYWVSIYPITYYFIGSYISEYGFNIRKKLNFILIIVAVLILGAFNYYRSYNSQFVFGIYSDWGSLQNTLLSCLVFGFLLNLNLSKISVFSKKVIIKISELSLGIYLSSWIFDNAFYPRFNAMIPEITSRMNYFFIIVSLVFICSFTVSFMADYSYKIIIAIFNHREYNMKKLFILLKKYEEVINYLIIGTLTTIISLTTYYLCVIFVLNPSNPILLQIANIISWVVSVTFAFWANRKFVFKSQNSNIVEEGSKFFGARIVTLFIDMVFMFFWVSVLLFNDKIIKIISNILVLILNYIFSKFLVFKDRKKRVEK